MKIQLHADYTSHGAGFLASWEAWDAEDISSFHHDDHDGTEEGYLLSFPQTLNLGPNSEQDQFCLQTRNLKIDGQVTLHLYGKNDNEANPSMSQVNKQLTCFQKCKQTTKTFSENVNKH